MKEGFNVKEWNLLQAVKIAAGMHQAMITLPEADYIFYADVDNVPYGEKTREEVRNLVDHAVGFLVGKGCQAIVLACNTATRKP